MNFFDDLSFPKKIIIFVESEFMINVENLTKKEFETFTNLMNKLRSTPKVTSDNPLIDEILVEFSFSKVEEVINALDWKWSPEAEVPTIQRLKTSAKSLLEDACDLRLNEYRNSHYDVGISASSGGFKATAYCDESLTKIEALKLEFIVAEWTASVNNPF